MDAIQEMKTHPVIAAKRKRLAKQYRELRSRSPEAARIVYLNAIRAREALMHKIMSEIVCEGSA